MASQDHHLQLDALAAADCREAIVETASTRGERPKLTAALAMLKPGDTLVVYKIRVRLRWSDVLTTACRQFLAR